jgi:hypothetical protein
MGKGYNAAQLAELQKQAYAMRTDGATMGAIQAELGLNYSQAWWGIAEHMMATPTWAHLAEVGQHTGAALGQAIASARNAPGVQTGIGLSNSWGWLAVRFGMPESRVRSLYSEATGIQHTGLRIGKGGRYAGGLEDQYVGAARLTGIVRPVGQATQVATQAVASPPAASVGGQSMANLRKQARALGMPAPQKANKQALLAYLEANAG